MYSLQKAVPEVLCVRRDEGQRPYHDVPLPPLRQVLDKVGLTYVILIPTLKRMRNA
jgi:hypothetical protein